MSGDRGSAGFVQDALPPLAWALAYAEFELRVAPARANHELLINPKRATCDPETIVALWSRHPFADVAWLLPPTILAVAVDNRYRRLAQFGGDDARSAETPAIATEKGGACLLFSATSRRYRSRTAIKDSAEEDAGIEILFGSHILLPSSGTGREWIRPLSETPPAPAPDWVENAAVIPDGERKPDDLFRWARSSAHGPVVADALAVARALGCRARARRGNYQAKCPAHNDRRPSLSIRNADSGRLQLHCFAGCSFGEIVAALEQRGILPGRRP